MVSKLIQKHFDIYSYHELPPGSHRAEDLDNDFLAELEQEVDQVLGKRWADFEVVRVTVKETRLPHLMDFKDGIRYKGTVTVRAWT